MNDNQINWRLIFKTFCVSLLGAIIFYFLRFPIPWLLGPLVAILFGQTALKQSFQWHSKLQQTGLVIIGFMLGSSFTADMGQQVILHLPWMLLVTLGTILFSLLLGYIVALCSGMSMHTGIFGSIPGGLTQMVALSEEYKEANTTVVTIMQLIRILMVVFLIPLMVHYGMASGEAQTSLIENHDIIGVSWYSYVITLVALWIGTRTAIRIKFPTPFLTGPLFVTIMLVLIGMPIPILPKAILIVGQMLFSTHMAVQMDIKGLKKYGTIFLLLTLLSSLLLIVFALGTGWLLTKWQSLSFVSAFLGTAPGGIDVMGITAKEVGANLPVITAYQVFRMFFIILVVPPILRKVLSERTGKKYIANDG